ncbi:MAG TPA: respiratory nitrate reductase subunit gamma [Actinomycetes bacterium]
MSAFLWGVVPYIALTSFAVGLVWRYRYDKFGWTTRSSQMYEGRLLAWGGPLFHFGILGVLIGHFVGLVVPSSWTETVGISEHSYHLVSVTGGTITGLMTIIGLALLIYRRRTTLSVFRATTRMDKAMYAVLGAVIVVGTYNTIAVNLLGAGHDYRQDVAVWFRSVFWFRPDTAPMSAAPASFQLHALLALLLIGLWPFTRLVHVFSAPVGYLARPYIVYRTRDAVGAARAPRRGWERIDG